MGLSNGSSESKVYLKLRGMRQEDEYPFLAKSVKKDNRWTTEGEWKEISGQLKSVKFTVKSSEQYGDKEMCEIEIVDDVVYNVEFSLSSGIGRNIINSLSSKESAEIIKLSFYVKSKDGKNFKSVYVELDGEMAKWSMPYADQKKLVTEIKDPDSGEVIKRKYDKLLAKLKESCTITGNDNAKPSGVNILEEAANDLDKQMNAQTAPEEDWDGDLPF